MIDAGSQLLAGLMVVFVLIRAIKLDRQLPWFDTVRKASASVDASPHSPHPASPWGEVPPWRRSKSAARR